jgi:hypothetical protein
MIASNWFGILEIRWETAEGGDMQKRAVHDSRHWVDFISLDKLTEPWKTKVIIIV